MVVGVLSRIDRSLGHIEPGLVECALLTLLCGYLPEDKVEIGNELLQVDPLAVLHPVGVENERLDVLKALLITAIIVILLIQVFLSGSGCSLLDDLPLGTRWTNSGQTFGGENATTGTSLT